MRPAVLAGLIGAQKVGGVAVGDAGATGSMYEGYTLSFADDFAGLDILSPANSRGRWWTTRTYLAGARGSDTLLGTMYDTDPLFTGYNDSNRGVPVGYNNMSVASSVLRLQARKATTQEQTHMQSVRNEVAAMISGPGAVHWYPSAAGTGDIIYEARVRFSAAAGNPAGWHPTVWLQSLNPVIAIDSDELDWEGNSQAAYLHRNVWTGGSAATASAGTGYAHDGQMHTISFVINTTNVRLYIDGTLYATGAWNGNSKGKPQYPLITSHIYNGNFEGEDYSQSAWNADADGASLDVDWVRVWRRTGRSHIRPLVYQPDVNVAYGASTTITLPSALALWGDASVSEYVQVVYHEENEPGVSHSSAYSQLPTGVTYDSGSRQITVNITSGKTGRLNFVVSAWKADGATGEPLRFAVNVGPRISVSRIDVDAGSVSYNLYAVCDCGVLTSNGTSRAKTISVSGLAGSGLSYDDSTGLLTGTAVTGNYSINVTCTNSLGQSASAAVTLAVASPVSLSYASWTSDGVGWFDASDSNALTVSGSSVTALINKRSGQGDLTGSGASRTLNVAAQNGRNTISLARDVSSSTSPARYSTPNPTAPLAAMFQGSNRPFTVIVAFRPTDTNTGYIWAASATVDATDSQAIALIRRNATASSVRRQLVTATPNDVSFGAGQSANAWRVVAVKHTGTAVSVWDTSTTAAVSGQAQSTAAFGTALNFRIGAASTNGGSPGLAAVACSMDFAEMIVQSTARTDAEIQQAMTDMAAKWGITLS